MKFKLYRTLINRFVFLSGAFVIFFQLSVTTVSAASGTAGSSTSGSATTGLLPTISQDEIYYNQNICSSASTSSGSTGTPAPSNGAPANWNSNVQPPYYLESFVINVLQDLAAIANVPQTSTVTQEHVVALVAWAYVEGGNITNQDIFNIWNTGYQGNGLVAGASAGNGTQSYVSFNAGVSAAADTMVGSLQNRLEQTLIQPGSTAEKFMQALTYYQQYPGNTYWAQADGNYPGWTQQRYIDTLNSALSQTRVNYDQEASLEIGPGQEGTNHVPSSQLQFGGGATNPTGNLTSSAGCAPPNNSSNCTSGSTVATGNAAIACDVLKYDPLSYDQGWHSSGSVFHQRCNATYPTQAPPAIGPNCATDCSGLVNLALYDVFNNDINETTYGEVADTKNFEQIHDPSKLLPGDFIQPAAEAGDHVVVIISINGNKAQTFAANTSQLPQPDQVNEQPYTLSPGDVYLRYIGIGSTYPK